MAGDIITSSGARVFIGPVIAASSAISLAAFQAISLWTEVGLVESIAPFGDKASLVTFAAINDARMRKAKGTRDAGDVDIVVGHDPLDTGQLAVEAAQKTNTGYAIKVTLPDAKTTAFFFRALVVGEPINIGGNDNVVRKTYSLAIDSEVFPEKH